MGKVCRVPKVRRVGKDRGVLKVDRVGKVRGVRGFLKVRGVHIVRGVDKVRRVRKVHGVLKVHGVHPVLGVRQVLGVRKVRIVRQVRRVRARPCIEDLSDELLLKVFSYLTTPDLIRISRVCRRWNRVKGDPSLWVHVDLTECYQIQSKNMYQLLDSYMTPHLQSLSLRAYIYTGGGTRQLSLTLMRFLTILCPQLWRLSLHAADLRHITLCQLPLTLRALELHNCELDDEWLLTAPGVRFPPLERLVVKDSTAYLEQRMGKLGTIPSLRSLVVIRPNILTEWGLPAGLQNLRGLEHFALLDSGLSADFVLDTLVLYVTGLRRLCITIRNLSPVGLECLSQLPALERLTLVGPVTSTEIPDPRELLAAFLDMPKLNTLEMVGVNWGHRQASVQELLCNGLPCCKVVFSGYNPNSRDFWM